MCIICVSEKGVRQPNLNELSQMFQRNPDGAGYMVARDGRVEIHKGFMSFSNFLANVQAENFTDDDVVIYHFRISTQGGVNPSMCHPFPLTKSLKHTKALDVLAKIGIAHNGIIPLTTNRNDKEYSDTAHFIAEYMPHVIRHVEDIRDEQIQTILGKLAESKLAIMDGTGYVAIIGNFITESSGLKFSNSTYKNYNYGKYYDGLFNARRQPSYQA